MLGGGRGGGGGGGRMRGLVAGLVFVLLSEPDNVETETKEERKRKQVSRLQTFLI